MSTAQKSSQVGETYLACRNGDVDIVKTYLMTFKESIDDLNPLEPSVNSTPLHAASYYGHKDIVQLLLEHGCDRSKVNDYGLTAYEEAANDEIRQLFKRCYAPNCSRRFQEESTEDYFDFVQRPKEIVSIYRRAYYIRSVYFFSFKMGRQIFCIKLLLLLLISIE